MHNHQENVLLVQDDAVLRRVLSARLVQKAYGMRTATDGVHALAENDSHMPNVSVSDLNMLRMSIDPMRGRVKCPICGGSRLDLSFNICSKCSGRGSVPAEKTPTPPKSKSTK
jgi:hypothetical protein